MKIEVQSGNKSIKTEIISQKDFHIIENLNAIKIKDDNYG